MKKLFTILLCLLSFSLSYAGDREEIRLEDTPSSTTPRSVVQKPKVSIDTESQELFVRFSDQADNYTLFVYDDKGAVVYQSSVASDGMENSYGLPNLESGFYSITIEGSSKSFSGEFAL